MLTLGIDDPLAAAAVEAIHTGDVQRLGRLLADHPELITARVVGPCGGDEGGEGEASRTLLGVATDWPGHYPNGAATVAVLARAGADLTRPSAAPNTRRPHCLAPPAATTSTCSTR